MIIMINAANDKGNVRTRNEDMIMVGNEFLRDKSKSYEFNFESSEHPLMVAVADGMGGHKGGDYASEFVLKELNKTVKNLENNLSFDKLKIVLNDNICSIHEQLIGESLTEPEKAGMGSTFVGVLFYNNSIYYINIGDSRLYRIRDGILTQITRDHSLSELTKNPDAPKNIILNSFGGGKKIFFDFEAITDRIMNDDDMLLCSDGLNGELSDEEIEIILSTGNKSVKLVEAVKNKEGQDNISVVMIKYLGSV